MKNKSASLPREAFDPDWYASTYPDVGLSKLDPTIHYLNIGTRLSRPPTPKDVQPDISLNQASTQKLELFKIEPTGYIDFPLENDFIGLDYIKIIGWCDVDGEEIQEAGAYLNKSRRKTRLKTGLNRSDVSKVFPHIQNYRVGFEGAIYPAIENIEDITLKIEVVSSSGRTHSMSRNLRIHSSLKKLPLRQFCASSLVSQTLNRSGLFTTV